MGLISTLFGGSKAAKETVKFAATAAKGIGNWIDEQQLTDEERLKYIQARADWYLRMVEATREENGARAVTRRVMAWAIVGTVLTSFVSLALAIGFGVIPDERVTKIMVLADKWWIGEAFTSAVVFFFGPSLGRVFGNRR